MDRVWPGWGKEAEMGIPLHAVYWVNKQDKENQGSKTEQTNVLSKDVISNGIHEHDPIESWKRTLQIELSADKNILLHLHNQC